MKQIVLIICAIFIACLSMAQFEKSYSRLSNFENTNKALIKADVEPFDISSLMTTDAYNNISRTRGTVKYNETFEDEIPGKDWTVSFTHEVVEGYAELDWKVGEMPENTFNYVNGQGDSIAPMFSTFGRETVAKYSESQGKFAYFNSTPYIFPGPKPESAKDKGKMVGHMTLGPFNLTDLANPAIRWTQFYKKFNHDETFISYSTDNGATFTNIRINDIHSGWGKVNNNIVILPNSLNLVENLLIRFTFSQTKEKDIRYGAGYGWEVDDIQIVDNEDYEIEIGKIATDFFFPPFDPSKNFHLSSTFGSVPESIFREGAKLFFSAPFTNYGNEAVNPKLTVTITNPNGQEIKTLTYERTGDAVVSGKTDTLRMPKETYFNFEESEEIVIGKYSIKYEISIPGHEDDEENKINNVNNDHFFITDDGVYARDLDKPTGQLGPHEWSIGGVDGDAIGTLFYNFHSETILSSDVFISAQTGIGNEIEVSICNVLDKGELSTIQQTDRIKITSDMLGKWNRFTFDDAEPIPLEEENGQKLITQIFLCVRMYYTGENKKIFVGTDYTPKGSAWGIKWILNKSDAGTGIFTITNVVPVSLCLRINYDTGTSILEQAADNLDVNLYPNPANDFININASEEITSIEVLSIMGTTISKHNVNENGFTLPTSDLSNGNYILRIHTRNNVSVKQFSVVK